MGCLYQIAGVFVIGCLMFLQCCYSVVECLNPVEQTFYNYPGFWDWYRFPLKYPYQMLMTDVLDKGSLSKYDGGDIRDPNISSHWMLGDVTSIAAEEEFAIFKVKDKEGFSLLIYGTGELAHAASIAEINGKLERASYKIKADYIFHDLKYLYEKFAYGRSKAETPSGK